MLGTRAIEIKHVPETQWRFCWGVSLARFYLPLILATYRSAWRCLLPGETYKALCQKACRACGAQASMEEKWEVTFPRAGGSSLEFPVALRISCELVMIMKVNHQARQWPVLSQSWAHMLFNWRMGDPTTECSTSLPSVKSNGKSSRRKNLTGCYFRRATKNSVTTTQVPWLLALLGLTNK